jgi:hypothetical protein
MKDQYQPNRVTLNTKKDPYVINFTVDLTKIGGDGGFSCPKCGTPISPDDESKDNYEIIETKVKGDDLAEVVVQCNKCKKYIRLTGFLSPSEERENTVESETV